MAITLAVNTMAQDEEVVEINGVKWATRNLGEPHTFVQNPEDYGSYYQWNKSTMDVLRCGEVYSNATSWLSVNDPSPIGYRMPTLEEIQSLTNTTYVTYELTKRNSVTCGRFTDKKSGKSIYLPAAGYRTSYDNTFDFVGSEGCYWSSTQDTYIGGGYFACGLNFNNSGARWVSSDRCNGLLVRCIAENDNNAEKIVFSDKPIVSGYYDVLGRKLTKEPAIGIYIIVYDTGEAVKVIR